MAEHTIILSDEDEQDIIYNEGDKATADTVLESLVLDFLNGKKSKIKSDYILQKTAEFDALSSSEKADALSSFKSQKLGK